LQKEKKKLNIELDYIHIQSANIWKSTETSINKKPQEELKIIHEKQQQNYAIYPNYKHKQKHIS
jgi:hypothetical protein